MKTFLYIVVVLVFFSCSNGNAPGTNGQRFYEEIDSVKVDTVKVEPKENL